MSNKCGGTGKNNPFAKQGTNKEPDNDNGHDNGVVFLFRVSVIGVLTVGKKTKPPLVPLWATSIMNVPLNNFLLYYKEKVFVNSS